MEKIEQINYIKAPARAVYEALTTGEGLAKVWTKDLKVKPEIGFVNEFGFGDEPVTKMKIVELVQDQKIVWECIASDHEWIGTGISFEIESREKVTAVVLKHYNWRELTEFYQYCSYNWAMFLFSLKLHCEQEKGTPFQERRF
jgi:uncharacterized protein YndB with AHSA1/START domain